MNVLDQGAMAAAVQAVDSPDLACGDCCSRLPAQCFFDKSRSCCTLRPV